MFKMFFLVKIFAFHSSNRKQLSASKSCLTLLSVFPDLSQQHYYGIAVSSRKSIVGIDMQMSTPNIPLCYRISISNGASHL